MEQHGDVEGGFKAQEKDSMVDIVEGDSEVEEDENIEITTV